LARNDDFPCGAFDPVSRRRFLGELSLGLGAAALGTLLGPSAALGAQPVPSGRPHFAPRARRVIYLFQSGGPSHLDLWDHKPLLERMNGEEMPASVRGTQRLTGMTATQGRLALAGSQFRFARHGRAGMTVSELMPHTAEIADELCFVRSMHTEAINHDPAITFFQTGSMQPGRPSIGSWLSYGLGSENRNLPAFCVLLSRGRNGDQPIYSRLWGSGFLPSLHQGVQFRSGADPVLFLNDPDGMTRASRRRMLDRLAELNGAQQAEWGDPEIGTRVAQYEMAYRMQTAVPEAMSVAGEPDHVYEMYGPDSRTPGTFAANCLLARRLAERDVRFVQLYHLGWDQHGNLPNEIRTMARSVDQASAALVKDLRQRGLLDDTLVIWGGEFGRTSYSQGRLTKSSYGRDHHPRCFTLWMAGGGTRPGTVYGETDDFGYNVARNPVHVHDFQATMLHLLGMDHERLAFKYQGRRFRLTDVSGRVVKGLLA
jgi:hypothetical protein